MLFLMPVFFARFKSGTDQQFLNCISNVSKIGILQMRLARKLNKIVRLITVATDYITEIRFKVFAILCRPAEAYHRSLLASSFKTEFICAGFNDLVYF